MSPDNADDVEAVTETERPTVKLTGTEPRDQTIRHLQKALSATEYADKQFHIRQALQLLDVEDR